jgi:hypothetical protein
MDWLKRYFVANRAPILALRRARGCGRRFVRTRCGNADGFFLWGWQVIWRRPYSDAWAFDCERRRWVPSYELDPLP